MTADAPAPFPTGCPRHNKEASSDAPSEPQQSSSKCPVDHASLSGLNPLNNIPANLSQAPAPGQKVKLPTTRTVSSIPRGTLSSDDTKQPPAEGEIRGGGAYGDGEKWEYPSPQQFYNALKKKGWETPEDQIETMVDIHNFLNEGAWEQVLEWEKTYHCECSEPRSLMKFQGRPRDISPKARMNMWFFGAQRPFDRHDWTIDRCGRRVRYIIDYYSAPDENEDTPVFHLDVRPALDSPSAFLDRTKAGFWDTYKRFTGKDTQSYGSASSAGKQPAGSQ